MKCKNCGRQLIDGSLYCNWCGKYQLKAKDEITVPNPEKLPSGKWRIYLRKEKISVTRNTPDACRKEALRLRKQWLKDEAEGKHDPPPETKSLGDVVDDYIAARQATLGASTISGYQSIRDNRFRYHMSDDAKTLDTQKIIDDEIALGISAKTITNAWGLCSSALKHAKLQFD
mgnify:CR=1 FL=1